MVKDKRSFFERLTGVRPERPDREELPERKISIKEEKSHGRRAEWIEESTEEEGQLTVDVYQTPDDIIIKTITAGVKPEELDISITRDMVTIHGHREEAHEVTENDYFSRELYWGSFSRNILLPQEVDVEGAEASEKHGLLTIKLPKLDKHRETKLKVKSN
ncbi:MAG TPA: Hsp20/alpha crystallin family protein [Candidatus Paceibacterota bacterium]